MFAGKKTITVKGNDTIAVEKVYKTKDHKGNAIPGDVTLFKPGSVIKLGDTARYEYKFYRLAELYAEEDLADHIDVK